MNISNINDRLNQTITDPGAGVKLALLTGEEGMSVFALELAAGQCIPAHYHREGIETYFILEGRGSVQTGILQKDKLCWNPGREVKEGDCFTIYPGEVHQFTNRSAQSLRILGTAPLSHSREDRYFIGEKTGLPE